jgi:hypothetical protein
MRVQTSGAKKCLVLSKRETPAAIES